MTYGEVSYVSEKTIWASGPQSGLFSSYSDSFTQTLSLFNPPFANVTSL